MPEYRFYFVGEDGHFQNYQGFAQIINDETAIAVALEIIDGKDIEVWSLDRKVAVIDHATKSVRRG